MKKDQRSARQSRLARLDDVVVYSACNALARGESIESISEFLEREFGQRIHRTQINKVIAQGFRRGFMLLTPPLEGELTLRMMERFVYGRAFARSKTITVVDQGRDHSLGHVAAVAAQEIVSHVRRIAQRKRGTCEEIHIGFGAGMTMGMVAQCFANLVRVAEDLPPLVLHALTSGFDIHDTQSAPVVFLNVFNSMANVKTVGVFALPYVDVAQWESARHGVGFRAAVIESAKLDIVVTALASKEDEHGELNRLIEESDERGQETLHVLNEAGRVGDVLYQPFSLTGPIVQRSGIRAVTILDLDQLVKMANDPDKAVILVAGPCGHPDCGRSRDDALLPLLTQDSLAVWSHLITDQVTADRCLKLGTGRSPEGTDDGGHKPAALRDGARNGHHATTFPE